MEKDEVIEIFNNLVEGKVDKIVYSIGYKRFEEIYEEFKKEFNLEKKINGIEVIITLKDWVD